MTHTQPVRVLHLGSPAGLYGAERWILALVRHLDPKKISSVIGVIQDDFQPETPPLIREAQSLGIDTMVIRAPGRINLAAIFKLRKFLKNREIDLVHTHWYKTDIIGWLATRGIRCKNVSTPHGWSKNAGMALLFYEWLDRLVFLFLDAVVPLSAELYEGLKKIPFLEKKLTLIPNGVDLEELKAVTAIAEPVHAMKQSGHVVVGYVGRLAGGKDIDTLLKAMARIRSFPWFLVVVGEGDQQAHLVQMARDLNISRQVLFTGFKPDRLSYLKGFDLFVLPSLSEGIPRCLMEAMGAGIPVIASDIPGCRVLVDHGQSGFLFKPGNDLELAALLKHLSGDGQTARKTAFEAARRVRQTFSSAKMATAYQNLYIRLRDDSK